MTTDLTFDDDVFDDDLCPECGVHLEDEHESGCSNDYCEECGVQSEDEHEKDCSYYEMTEEEEAATMELLIRLCNAWNIDISDVMEMVSPEDWDPSAPLDQQNDLWFPSNMADLDMVIRRRGDEIAFEMWDEAYVKSGRLVMCMCDPTDKRKQLECSVCGVERWAGTGRWHRTAHRWSTEQVDESNDAKLPECKHTQVTALCADCGLQRYRMEDGKQSAWMWYEPRTKTNEDGKKVTYGSGKSYTPVPSCSHVQQAVEIPNVGTVYCSQGRYTTSYEKEWIPDLHIVLGASSQNMQTLGIWVDWPDHSVPSLKIDYMDGLVNMVYEYIDQGKMVEMGCIGAHGRTGTFLAMLATKKNLDVDSEKIIKKLKKIYCDRIVETSSQEWYVEAYRAWLRGEEIPERPKSAVSKSVWTGSGSASTLGSTEMWDAETWPTAHETII